MNDSASQTGLWVHGHAAMFRLLVRERRAWASGATLAFVAAVCLPNASRADDLPAGSSTIGSAQPGAAMVGSVAPSVVSAYVWRGQLLARASVQTDLSATSDRFGLGAWSSLPLESGVAHQSDAEIDPYGYWRIAVDDRWAVIPGFQVYTFPGANTGIVPSTAIDTPGLIRTRYEANVSFETHAGGMTVLAKVAYDAILRGETGEVTALYGIPVPGLGTEVDLKAMLGAFDDKDAFHGAQPAAEESGMYGMAGASIPFQVSAACRIAAGYAYAAGWDERVRQDGSPSQRDPQQASRGVASLTLTVNF